MSEFKLLPYVHPVQVLLHQVNQAFDSRYKGPAGVGHASTQLLRDLAIPPTGGFVQVQLYRLVIRTAGGRGRFR